MSESSRKPVVLADRYFKALDALETAKRQRDKAQNRLAAYERVVEAAQNYSQAAYAMHQAELDAVRGLPDRRGECHVARNVPWPFDARLAQAQREVRELEARHPYERVVGAARLLVRRDTFDMRIIQVREDALIDALSALDTGTEQP